MLLMFAHAYSQCLQGYDMAGGAGISRQHTGPLPPVPEKGCMENSEKWENENGERQHQPSRQWQALEQDGVGVYEVRLQVLYSVAIGVVVCVLHWC